MSLGGRLGFKRAALHIASLAVLCGALLTTSACITTRNRSMRVPSAQTLYVVAFVDLSREGKVGVPLAEAIQYEVYRRDPARLSVVFDERSVVLDGTVVKVVDVAAAGGDRLIKFSLEMILANKRGDVVAKLENVDGSATYRVHANRKETERLRDEAFEKAIASAAIDVVDAVDLAGANYSK